MHTLKSSINALLLPFAKQFPGVNPTWLTLLGSIPSLLVFFLVKEHFYSFALLAILGTSLDMLDGIFARANNRVTAFGGFLDSTMDRVADFFLICAFAAGGIVSWQMAVVLLSLSFLISYIRSRAELAGEGKISLAVGLVERPQRIIGLFLALLLYVLFPEVLVGIYNLAQALFIILIMLSLITVLQRIMATQKLLK